MKRTLAILTAGSVLVIWALINGLSVAAYDLGPPAPPSGCKWVQEAYASEHTVYSITVVPPDGDGSSGWIHGDLTLYGAVTNDFWGWPCSFVNRDAFYLRASVWGDHYDRTISPGLDYDVNIRVWLNGAYLGSWGLFNHWTTDFGVAWYTPSMSGSGHIGADNLGSQVYTIHGDGQDCAPSHIYPYANF